MLATLDVPYVDTTAEELVWTLDHPTEQALARAVIPLTLPGARLELRILGASHQVVLDWEHGTILETVACLPGRPPELPAEADRRIGGRRYRFRARVEEMAPADLHEQVGVLRRRADLDGDGGRMVLAEFPSHPDAVTALSAGSDDPGVSWVTWHVYPNSGQIVTTSTEVL
ncbi:DUF2617 family protein [Phytoactinopolyspora endophytica]|uniref:DUF2617 family protein n=1 Tax=Phytoactinopolyspora endophytica TaxID=1642495 RepID=UPI0013EC7DEC|nr:DUF2617 family protein [Phytoactinopolyspora endophytica]